MLKSLKAARQEVDLSQKQVAEMLGISPCYLSSIENNKKTSARVVAEEWKIINQRRQELCSDDYQSSTSDDNNDNFQSSSTTDYTPVYRYDYQPTYIHTTNHQPQDTEDTGE